jgi:shikimate kinase
MRDSSHEATEHPALGRGESLPSRIILVGFMGAGKSTVGPLLAKRLGFTFYDADQYLEQEKGASVAEIFQAHGQSGFRAVEAETIRRLMQFPDLVLALGGGALETASTRILLQDATATRMIYLQAPAEMLLTRCDQQSGAQQAGPLPARPLLQELRNNLSRLHEKLASREPHYEAAHLTISTANLTPEQVADRILDALHMSPRQEERPR